MFRGKNPNHSEMLRHPRGDRKGGAGRKNDVFPPFHRPSLSIQRGGHHFVDGLPGSVRIPVLAG
jgi:hypothetical protein